MSIPLPRRPADGERGAALIAMLLAFLLAGSYFLLREANGVPSTSQRAAKTAAALAQAKEALIARAVTDNTRPGSLPCPDLLTNAPSLNNIPGDGKADLIPFGQEQCPSDVGWLPWRTLDLPDPRDTAGERLWYALSSTLRDHASAQPINSDTATTLTLDGAGHIAALVFAPGAPLAGQSRPSNGVTDYLDGSNNNGDSAYVSGPTSDTFNDVAMPLTRRELMQALERRVAKEALNHLDAYRIANGVYPYPARSGCAGSDCVSDKQECRGRFPVDADLAHPHDLPNWSPALPAWFIVNDWAAVLYYGVGLDNLKTPHLGGLTSNCGASLAVDGNGRQLVLFTPGAPLPGITRPSNNLDDYLEDAENRDGWGNSMPGAGQYVTPSTTANDRLFVRP